MHPKGETTPRPAAQQGTRAPPARPALLSQLGWLARTEAHATRICPGARLSAALKSTRVTFFHYFFCIGLGTLKVINLAPKRYQNGVVFDFIFGNFLRKCQSRFLNDVITENTTFSAPKGSTK